MKKNFYRNNFISNQVNKGNQDSLKLKSKKSIENSSSESLKYEEMCSSQNKRLNSKESYSGHYEFNTNFNNRKTSAIKEEDSYIDSSASSISTKKIVLERFKTREISAENNKKNNFLKYENLYYSSTNNNPRNSTQNKYYTENFSKRSSVKTMTNLSRQGYSNHYNNRVNGSILKNALMKEKNTNMPYSNKKIFEDLQVSGFVNNFWIFPKNSKLIPLIHYSFKPISENFISKDKSVNDVINRTKLISSQSEIISKDLINSQTIFHTHKPGKIKNLKSCNLKKNVQIVSNKKTENKSEPTNKNILDLKKSSSENISGIGRKNSQKSVILTPKGVDNSKLKNGFSGFFEEKTNFNSSPSNSNLATTLNKTHSSDLRLIYEFLRMHIAKIPNYMKQKDNYDKDINQKLKLLQPCVDLLKKRKLDFNFSNFSVIYNEIFGTTI